MGLDSNPHVQDRRQYHANDHIAMLEAIKDAGTDGIAIPDLYGPYGQQSDILEFLLSALIVDYVDLQWSGPNGERGRVLAEDKLQSTRQEQLNITTDPSILLDGPETAISGS